MSRRVLPALIASLAVAACTLAGPPPSSRMPPGPPTPRARPAPAPPEPSPAPEGESGRPAPLTFPEVRALWVVRTTLTSPERVRVMVERASRAGFNTLLVQVRGRGDAWYRSDLEPRAAALDGQPDAFDPLALTLREAHAREMAVHVWVNALLVTDLGPLPTDPLHLAVEDPEGLAVPLPLARELFRADPRDPAYVARLHAWADAHREHVEGLFASPSDPFVRQRVVDVVEDLASRYDVDGVHLDYIRYPGRDFDYSRAALEAFRSWISEEVPAGERAAAEGAWAGGDPLAYTAAFPERWDDFRREQVTRIAEEAARAARRARPGVTVSAAVFPDPVDARRSRFQDWASWVRWGVVDAVAPMAYTGDDRTWQREVGAAVDSAGAGRVWAGIGVYLTDYAGTVDRIRWARQMGTRGFSLFSYDWAVASGEAKAGVPFLERVGRAALLPGG